MSISRKGCSHVPRNGWKDGKVTRSTENYAKWAMEVAEQEGAAFIDLNELVAKKYELKDILK